MSKRIIVLGGLVAGILLLAVVGVWLLANPNRHRDFIHSQLESRLGRKVTLGEMSLGLLPLRFQVKDPIIAEDPSLNRQSPFIRAEDLQIRIRLLPLLRGNVQIDSLELQRPSVELIRTKQGAWNFATLGPATTGPAAGSGAAAPAAPAPAETEFSLEKLTIADGQIGITDLQQNQPRAGYDHIDLTLLNFSPGKPFTFDLAAHVQGAAGQELRLKGEGGPLSTTSPADTPFQGTLGLTNVSVENLVRFLNSQTIPKIKGTLSGESAVANRAGALTASGKIKLENARVNDLDIGYPIAVDYKLNARVDEGLITIDQAAVQLGQTPIMLSGSLNTSATPLTMDMKVKSGDASITEIARLASAFGVAFAPQTSVTGRASTDVRIKGSAAKPELTGTIAGRDLQISGQGIPQPVQVKAVDLTLTPMAIRSNEFTATSGKTTVLGQFALLQYASNSPSLELGLESPGATLPEIQSIAKAYGVTGLDQLSGQGTLNFDLHAKGLLQSLTTAAVTRALNGTINLNFSPLKIAGFDAAHELGKLAGFASDNSAHNQTDIVRMTGRVDVKNGIAQTNDLRAQLGIGNLSASGVADLAAETLNLKISAVFTKEFSEKMGVRTGGILTTALSNSAGELVVPAFVTGTFRQPKFAPDLKTVAQLQRQKYLPSLDNPAAVGNLIEALTGKAKTGTTTDQPAQDKGSVVKDILGGLFGGQKKDSSKDATPKK